MWREQHLDCCVWFGTQSVWAYRSWREQALVSWRGDRCWRDDDLAFWGDHEFCGDDETSGNLLETLFSSVLCDTEWESSDTCRDTVSPVLRDTEWSAQRHLLIHFGGSETFMNPRGKESSVQYE